MHFKEMRSKHPNCFKPLNYWKASFSFYVLENTWNKKHFICKKLDIVHEYTKYVENKQLI